MSYVTALGVANPPHQIQQSAAANFMVKAMQLKEEEARRLKALYKTTGIETRYSVLSDYQREYDFEFYPNNAEFEPFPSTADRMAIYKKHAAALGAKAVTSALNQFENFKVDSITHLIVVSCTGMYAPGLDIDLVHRIGLQNTVQRTGINFMGCYAAFNAIKLATSITESDRTAKVLVVCVELCSIHFQKEKTDDNFLSNALFADGAAALVLEALPRPGVQLKTLSFFSDLAPAGANDMAWNVGDFGFEMKLSSYVPDIIKTGIAALTRSLLAQNNSNLNEIAYFAIHPGGKRILEVIEQELGITKSQNQHAYNVLRTFGNMSSPTVLFVLRDVLSSLKENDHGKKVMSFAFGPGLTLESMTLQVHCQ